MNLESARVRIRERNVGEVLDLTFLFLKLNARQFLILGACLALPMSALTHWLFASVQSWYLWFVTLAVLTPYYRLFFLLLAGEAMFRANASVWRSLRLPVDSWFLLRLAFMRLVKSLTIIGIVHEWWTRYFTDEIVALERVPPEAFHARAKNLHANLGMECHQHLVRHLSLGALFLVSFAAVWLMAKMIAEENFTFSLSPAVLWSYPVILAFWVAQIYFAVSEFLFYLNLRTIHEGWELFLQMRIVKKQFEATEEVSVAA